MAHFLASARLVGRIGVSRGFLAMPRQMTPMWARGFGGAAEFLDEKEVVDRVLGVIKTFEKVDASKVQPTSHFSNDLGLDSLDAVEIVMALEEEFAIEIPDSEADKIQTCEDAIKFISSHPQAK